jgi:hypothetical protein
VALTLFSPPVSTLLIAIFALAKPFALLAYISFFVLLLSLSFTLAPVARLFTVLRQLTPISARNAFFRSRLLSTTAMTYPTPAPAPQFTHTPESILSATRRLIDSSRAVQDGIAKDVTPETATFDSVVELLARDENVMGLEASIIGFYQYVSTEKELRDASSEAEKLLDVPRLSSRK